MNNIFNQLIKQLRLYQYKFIDSGFNKAIEFYIKNTFTSMNVDDIDILVILTKHLIEDIATRYNITDTLQFTQNNGRDIVSLCLTLLPFIDNNHYTKITSLKHLFYIKDKPKIESDILEAKLKDCIKENFPYSNFSLGLLNKNRTNDTLLELYQDNQHIIYRTIHNNFVSMLETIKITNGKLFINWINTTPMVNYKNTIFYKKSIKEIDSIKPDTILDVIKNNKGLWLGDYYNVMTNGYYLSIKQIKWVIFCKNISNKYYYSIQYVNKIFNNTIDTMFKYFDFNSMEDSDKYMFSNSISSVYNDIKHDITNIDEIDILRNLLIFMANNSTDKNLLPECFDKFKIPIMEDNMDLDPDEDDNTITNQDLVEAFETFIDKPEYLWKYLKETLVKLKATIYGKYLIENNKINMDRFNFIEDKDKVINLKNIYNIAKLLAHSSSDFTQYGSHYKSLYREQVVEFFTKFCMKDNINWINIRNNIMKQEGIDGKKNNVVLDGIKNGWNSIKIELVWEYLKYNGLLSEFRVNTDALLVRRDKLKEYLETNKKIFDENYYMTNDTYNNLSIYDKDEPSEKIKYSKLLTKKGGLVNYLFYANDWISLLNFFNHFINHSVIYVTGSTGTGKSTQVPKLTLYALKMYDYKMDGKVVCTEPRIVPTQDNAKRIAVEMGLNIVDIKKKLAYKTSNYYLQYQHNKDKHTKELCSHLTLKMVTDGSLLTELIQNPLLKLQYKSINSKDTLQFSNSIDNKYDIVIIDEAHEHNTNMDIILTLMRQICIYNNMIRLIIVSATMDDDEPIYRYYYKLINDNIVFPIKQPLLHHPILPDIEWHIDAIYLDRRMNISPPGATTQYKVDEIYNESIEKDYGIDERKNSILAQTESFKIVNMICNKSLSGGDILLFSTGEREIIEAVNYLNSTLPEGTIALPYYGTMDSRYRDIISNINIMIGTIRNKRSMVGEQWGAKYIEVSDVSEGTYRRAVIIATNVAEASITIESLKYVVDTGYSKVNRYDEITDSFNMSIEKISESSRIQRRGRVGRVGEGTVYFTYGKGKRAKVVPKYTITLNDFHTNFLQLASSNNKTKDNNMELLWDSTLSPYLYQFTESYLELNNLDNYKNIKEKNINTIIISQFLLCGNENKEPIPSWYFYPFDEYMQDKLPSYFNRYIDGYKAIQLLDMDGTFYIVHPYENRIERNVMGHIIKYKYNQYTSERSLLDYKIFNPIIRNMQIKMLYLPINNPDKLHEGEYKKTEYFDKLNEMTSIANNEMSEKDSNILLLGAGYDILTETCMVLSLLNAISVISPNISTLIRQTGKFLEIDMIKTRYGSDSDVSSLYSICQILQKEFKDFELFKLIEQYKKGSNTLDKSIYKIQYQDLRLLYYKKEYKKMGTVECYNLFNWLHFNGKLDMDTGFLYWLGKSGLVENKIKNDIKARQSTIDRTSEQLYLNTKVVGDYLNRLTINILNIITSKKDIDGKYEEGILDWVKKLRPSLLKNLTNNSIEYRLNLCFFFAQPLIAVRNETEYISMHDGSALTINQLFNQTNTLCSTPGSYLYYYNMDKGKMNIIANIDPLILPIYYSLHYNTYRINTTYTIYDNTTNIVKFNNYNNTEWEKLVEIVRNNWSFSRFPFNCIELSVVQQYIKNINK